MTKDIDAALEGWNYEPGAVQARVVTTADGREVLQLRVDLGVLQMEAKGRPDGARPHGSETFFDHLRKSSRRKGDKFVLTEEQCQEADREFVQFYHRRLCWLALHRFDRAIVDADHTLAFMDFVRDHSPNEEYTQAHEQYRGFVLFHRTQAETALAIEKDDAEGAIDAIGRGLKALRDFFIAYDAEEHMEEDGMVKRLREMEQSLRRKHGIEATLREQLDRAIADEDYETAARIRDVLRKRR